MTACMAYVDPESDPCRIAETPETSEFSRAADVNLRVAKLARVSDRGRVAMSEIALLQLPA
jgi:hypothetical protein